MSDQQYQVLQPIQVTSTGLKTYTGDSILSNCFTAASVAEKDSDGIVLGVVSAEGPVALHDINLGELHCSTFVSSARNKIWWMTPHWGSQAQDILPETQFLLLQTREDGPYVLLLPLIDSDLYRATLRPPRKGIDGCHSLRLRIESGDASVMASKWERALYVAAGNDPFALLDAAVGRAAALSGGARPLVQKQVPKSLDVFGWCTWDAFYWQVSAKGIMDGLKSLRDGGVPPKLLVIDDGWQLTEVDEPYRQAAATARMAAANALKKPAIAEGITGGDPDAISHPTEATEAQAASHSDSQQNMLPCNLPRSSFNIDTSSSSSGTSLKGILMKCWDAIIRLIGTLVSKLMYMLNAVLSSVEIPSWALKGMSALALGPMQNKLLQLYAEGGDHSRRLSSVLANGKFSSIEAGPDEPWQEKQEDLSKVVGHIKKEYGLDFVYCWHALHAYWSGVSPSAAGTKPYGSQITHPVPTPGILELEPSMTWNPQVVAGIGAVTDPTQLHKDMHGYLAGSGVDGVKVDVQASVGLMGSKLGGGPSMTLKYHQSLESSVQAAFPGNHCINCMCHSTENLYRMQSTAVGRVSDDFYPTDAASWTSHLGICAYNSLFMSPLVQPDWDMFHSKHPAALLHATARMVSGSGIYVSDKPGAHDFELLKRMVLPDGSVLRPLLPGRPTKDILFADVLKDNKTLLKVWNMNPVNGVVGVFNVQGSSWSRKKRAFHTHDPSPPVLQTLVNPTDINTFAQASSNPQHFVMYSDQNKTLTLAVHQQDLPVRLEAGKSDVITVAPLFGVGDEVQVACIGFVNMLNPGGGVLKVKLNQAQGTSLRRSAVCEMSVKGWGKLMMYVSTSPVGVSASGRALEHNYSPNLKQLIIDISPASIGNLQSEKLVNVEL
nr:raffinose synthase 2 [Trebouxia lynnae]